MNSVLGQMINRYAPKNTEEKKNAIKEIMQEIILCGLSRAGFFKKAAFYGGTALRIFYGLDRFSEDLDFSLTAEDQSFTLSDYFPTLKKEVAAFGLNVEVTEKEKTNASYIRSAFLKGNTREHFLLFYADGDVGDITRNETVKIKFEVDIAPPSKATFEHKYRLTPAPYEVQMYDMPSLFAGKVHAVICRTWKSRVKGRDLYDYVFYLSQGTKINLPHLRERLIQSEILEADAVFSADDAKLLLNKRFDTIDYEQAKADVRPFIKDNSSLDIWNADFFKQITDRLI